MGRKVYEFFGAIIKRGKLMQESIRDANRIADTAERILDDYSHKKIGGHESVIQLQDLRGRIEVLVSKYRENLPEAHAAFKQALKNVDIEIARINGILIGSET